MPLLAVAAASVLLGTIGTASELGPDDLSPRTAAAWRTVLGAVALVAASWRLGAAPWRYRLPPAWLVAGAAVLAVNQISFFEGIERAGVALATVVTVAAIPVTAGLIDWARGARPRAGWALGVVVAVAGVAVLSGTDGEADRVGLAFALAAGVAAAGVGLVAQRLMSDRPVVTSMATVVACGAVVMVPLAASDAGPALSGASAVSTVVYLGVVTMGAAYVLWGAGLSRLGLGTAAAVSLLEPAVAAVLAVSVLDEPLTGSLVAGTVLVLAGVAVASRGATDGPPPGVLHGSASTSLVEGSGEER